MCQCAFDLTSSGVDASTSQADRGRAKAVAHMLSESQILIGLALTVALAVGCQIIASKFGIPAIILLLPVGFAAGALSSDFDPNKLFGAAFSPMVSIAVAIILFDGGLDLAARNLEGDDRRIVGRLRALGIPITWAGAGAIAGVLLGLSWKSALMLGAILIVSGPTVVIPILRAARPGKKLTRILNHEGTTVDPIGALIAVVVYQGLRSSHTHGLESGFLGFVERIGIGLVGGAVGILLLWIVLKKMGLKGILAAEAILAIVITIAGLCDAIQADTGLVAAITMGIVLANLRGVQIPEDRPFLKTVVQLTIGLLFISISATVTPASLRGVVWPSVGLVACLVFVVRPVVAALSTFRTELTRNERIFVGSMDPRGIVAASTAATFSAPLVALGLGGAEKLLPVTFLVIVGTVAIYGLGATPLARALKLQEPKPERPAEVPPT
jgi:NhaP-type Na+/H+ or K+/H+ antiporter